MKNTFRILSVVVGALTYVYLIAMTALGTGEGLSFSAFALGALILWITGFIMLAQKTNFAVPMTFALGASIIALILLTKGRCLWSGFDTFIAVLTIICVIFWLTSNSRAALILSVAAAVISAVPFIVLTWTHPEQSPIIANAGLCLSSAIAFFSAKTHSLEDRLYPGASVVVCAAMIIPWLVKLVIPSLL